MSIVVQRMRCAMHPLLFNVRAYRGTEAAGLGDDVAGNLFCGLNRRRAQRHELDEIFGKNQVQCPVKSYSEFLFQAAAACSDKSYATTTRRRSRRPPPEIPAEDADFGFFDQRGSFFMSAGQEYF